MTSEDLQDKRTKPRVPIATKVHLEFEKFSGFITEYSSNISEGGIFIKMNDPKPPGSIVSFEFKLSDNFKLIQGIGEVVWSRERTDSDDRPAGMGIRFQDLDSQSRELIRTMISNYVKRGGEPFNLEEDTQAPQEPNVSPPLEPTEPSQPEGDSIELLNMQEIDEQPKPKPDPPSVPTGSLEEDFQALFSVEGSSSEKPQEEEKKLPGKDILDLGVIEDETVAAPKEEKSPQAIELKETMEEPRAAKSPLRRAIPVIILFGCVGIGGGLVYLSKNKINEYLSDHLGWSPFGSPETTFQPAKPETTQAPTPKSTPIESPSPSEPLKTETPEEEIHVAEPSPSPTATFEPEPPTPASAPETPVPTSTPETKLAKAPEIQPTPSPKAPKPTASWIGSFEIRQITWEKSDAELVFTLWANANFPRSGFSHISLRTPGNPREVFKIPGVTKPLANPNFSINSSEVQRIRTGLHQKETGPELHVVFDLKDPKVQTKKIVPTGSKLLIHFAR